MDEVTYEIYILQGGKWTIESRYAKSERAVANEDAKGMHDNPAVVAVKVVKETYNTETHATYDTTVFSTEAAKPSIGAKKSFADMEIEVGTPDFADMTLGEIGFEAETADYDAPKAKDKKKAKDKIGKSPIGMIFFKIITITTVSLVFAFVATFAFTGSLFN